MKARVSTTLPEDLKKRVKEEPDLKFNELLEEKCREVLEERSGPDPYSFDFEPLTNNQRHLAKHIIMQFSDGGTRSDVVSESREHGIISHVNYIKSGLDEIVSSDLPVEQDGEGLDAEVRSTCVQCDGHTVRASAVLRSGQGHGEKGECPTCGHVFDGI